MSAVLFLGQHIGEFYTVSYQVAELTNVRRRDKAGLDHAAHIQVTGPLGVLTVGFITLLRFGVLGVGQRDLAGLFEDVEHRHSVFPCGFHADVRAEVFGKPTS